MSYEFVNEAKVVTTGNLLIYTCGGDAGVIFGLNITNNTASPVTITTLTLTSGGLTVDIIPPGTSIGTDEQLIPIGNIQKMVVSNGDTIYCQCGTTNGLNIILSGIEFSDYV